jgi:hypothetical protein
MRLAYQWCSIRCVAWSRWKAGDRLQHYHPQKEVHSSQLSPAWVLQSFCATISCVPKSQHESRAVRWGSSWYNATCHESGWIQAESFTQWFQQFLSHVRPKKEDQVVVVLDRHFSHFILPEKMVYILCACHHTAASRHLVHAALQNIMPRK